jgi:hypothetical protein
MRENRLMWFVNVMPQERTQSIRVVMKINNVKRKEGEEDKKKWLDTFENDMKIVGVCVGDIENQDE